jgi:hypothetical protein
LNFPTEKQLLVEPIALARRAPRIPAPEISRSFQALRGRRRVDERRGTNVAFLGGQANSLEQQAFESAEGGRENMGVVIIVLLVLLLVGALPTWPYSGGWGYYPSGGLGLVLLIVLILALAGRI